MPVDGTSNAAPERWRLRGVPSARGLGSWAEILAATHLPFDVRATYRTPSAFYGAGHPPAFGDLALVDCAARPSSATGPSADGPGIGQIVGFQYVRRGVERVRERKRECRSRPAT